MGRKHTLRLTVMATYGLKCVTTRFMLLRLTVVICFLEDAYKVHVDYERCSELLSVILKLKGATSWWESNGRDTIVFHKILFIWSYIMVKIWS